MGGQVSSIKAAAAGKFGSETRKRAARGEKVKISILAFEVANVMSKSIVLWQSLSDQEIIRLRTEVIRGEGVLKLVSDSEAALLGLACREKLQDLMALAGSVARLGKRCSEAALQGFEHVFTDILRQSIEVSALEFSIREMEGKVKKMERYIASTSNLYQELEILADLEQAVRRIQEEEDPAQRDNLSALEQKISWQRQEIKYLRELSLWNRTYDKIVMLLARTICTIHARIVCVFGPPAASDVIIGPSGLLLPRNGEMNRFSQDQRRFSQDQRAFSQEQRGFPQEQRAFSQEQRGFPQEQRAFSQEQRRSGAGVGFSEELGAPAAAAAAASATFVEACNAMAASTSPSPSSTSQASPNGDSDVRFSASEDIPKPPPPAAQNGYRNGSIKGAAAAGTRLNRLFFDPKFIQQTAPSSTLGGCALALHYANVIIIVEKMVKFPQLVGNDARDDLYRMLPKSLRLGLRIRLRSCFKSSGGGEAGGGGAAEEGSECVVRLESESAAAWRHSLDGVLSWLAPLAHNMIRWQSEHNFEQQVVSRTNVLLLQTLFFADQVKAEAAIVELLVGLNYLCWYEKEIKASIPALDYAAAAAASKDLDEYLDWQF